jgi:serine/threonine protein phosphatase PrpC
MDESILYEFVSSSKTSAGNVRSINEDSYFDSSLNGIWAVADGMGGHQSGDFASQLITQSLGVIEKKETLEEMVDAVRECLLNANNFLLEEASFRNGKQTIGSTVVVLVIQRGRCAVLWAGDSRLYRLHEQILELLTTDHSHVQELVDIGVLQAEEAENHPSSNIITRAIGALSDLVIEEKWFDIEEGDTFLLCSDGLYRELSETEIVSVLKKKHNACNELVELALKNECRDNVTVIVVNTLVMEKTILRDER